MDKHSKSNKTEVSRLTAKQEAYAQARADGLTQRQAYRQAYAYKGGQDSTADECACRVEANRKVYARIQELQERTAQGCALERDSITALLTDIATDSTRTDGARLKALDMLNRMQGSYSERHDVTVQGLTRADRLTALSDTLETLRQAWTDGTQ